MKVAFNTLGCKLNQYETTVMEEQFEEKGYDIVPFEDKADLYVINTCTVTGKTDYRSRQAVRRAVKTNKSAFIIVTGCYAQTNPQDIKKIAGVDLILGNTEKGRIFKFINGLDKREEPLIKVSNASEEKEFLHTKIKKFFNYTRAFIKIQDGCDSTCSYCKVRLARGPNRSEGPEGVLDQIKKLSGANYKEIVLSGIHLGTYGQDLSPKTDLTQLLKCILNIEELQRIRLSSIEPTEFTEELIDIVANSSKICSHLHIPLQSGDSEILKKMNRNYDPEYFRKLIYKLHSRIPDVSIGADVMVGFPGETEEKFMNTYRLIKEVPLTYLHVFNFSKRSGTAAADFPNQISPETRHTRSLLLRQLGKEKASEFKKRFIGKTLNVLIENKREKELGLLKGLSDNYLRILLDDSDEFMNKIVPVRITQTKGEQVFGELTV